MTDVIKIFLICRNNRRELEICLRSIARRTDYPHEIIIVDNHSTDKEMLNFLSDLSINGVRVYRNRFNLWVLGLNKALNSNLSHGDQFYVVSDSDIVVPISKDGQCWLQILLSEMHKNPIIGKLGLSLDLSFISKKNIFKDTFTREDSYYYNPQIGVNHIAPVDTTLAIYRYDYFMMRKPKFYPGHGVLARPHYYCCRTSKNIKAKHIGWRSYLSKERPQRDDISKAICFTLMGAYLDKAFLYKLPYFYQKFYQILRPIARIFWGMRVISLQLCWLLRQLPSNLNAVQKSFK